MAPLGDHQICEFETTIVSVGSYRHVCIHCETVRASDQPKYVRQCGKPRPKPAPKQPRGPCEHRGEIRTRTELCQGCCGKVRIYVFPCDIFGECTVGKKLPNFPDMRICENCEVFSEKLKES